MKDSEFLFPVIKALQPYNPQDLLAKIGALQLCPENVDQAIRLEALVHAINCIDYDSQKPIITRHKLGRICNEPPLGRSHIESQEDPSPNVFTEAFTFYGGTYIVFPGQLSDPTYILRHLNSAIFLSKKFEKFKQFQNEIYGMSLCIFEISNTIALKAGLERNMPPVQSSREIYIPADIEKRQNAVIFTFQEIEKILKDKGIDNSVLEYFAQPFGGLNANTYTIQNSPIHSRPLIKFENQIIVAEPWMLLASLQRQILLTAKKYELLDLLFNEYKINVLYTIGACLDRLGYKQLDYYLQKSDIEIKIAESFWGFDTDKILYAGTLFDDFTDFKGDVLFEENVRSVEGERLDKYLPGVEQQIRSETKNLDDFFYFLIDAGVGRSSAIGLNFDNFKNEPLLISMSAAELEILSLLYINDNLVLYKFAKAVLDLRQSTKVISWSTLDDFEIYRKNDFSFYLGDDAKPSLLNIAPGTGRNLKNDVLQKLDIHAVPSITSRGWIEVVNVYQVPSCPIYAPKDFHNHPISSYIEISPIPFWVFVEIEAMGTQKDTLAPNPGVFVDLISYWIWQINNELTELKIGIEFTYPIVIKIEIADDDQWFQNSQGNDADPSLLSINIISEFSILVKFKPGVIHILDSSTNDGELQIMQSVFDGISQLLALNGFPNDAKKIKLALPEIIERQRQIPTKKKILAINPNNNPSLLPGNMFAFRKVQEADISNLLDAAGLYLQSKYNLKVGEIPKDQHTIILNSLVEYYFNTLAQLISSLNSDDLLNFLVSSYEAIISERLTRRITITTQLACFSSSKELTQQLIKQIPEIDTAALSCRFLIEFAVTQPPSGEKRISYSIYDQLMALATEIISRGNQSDLARYGLFDFHFNFLRSKRLGFNVSEFNSKNSSYQNARSETEIVESFTNFSRWWKERTPVDPNDYPPHIKNLNRAFEAEFGLLLTDISFFLSELGNLSMNLDSNDFKLLELNQFVDQMSRILGWEQEKTHTFINFLSLSPREDFLNPPLPFKRTDIYPWRMSRGLSYLRRPLLIVKRKERSLICWGVRHLFASFDYLLQATVTGRLQDDYKSKEMQDFLGEIHKTEGEEFNNEVYQVLTGYQNVIVDKKVKKINGKRIGDPGNDLGDIDVLAFFNKTRTVAIIECKNLIIARNAIEMSREMESLFLGNKHNESTTSKHIKRCNWIKNNLKFVLDSYRIDDTKKWKVEPILVVSSEMMTPHFNTTPIPVYSISLFKSKYLSKYQ